jgi:hypothetical protein
MYIPHTQKGGFFMDTPHENRSFCSSCGAPLTGGAFCGKCGARIIATTAPAAAVEPVPAAEPAPVAVAAPAPEPLSIPTSITWRFPLIPVILLGIVFLMNLIPLFAQIGALTPGAAGNLAASFGLSFMEVCCLALLIVGMIVCKKERNLIVGFGFLGLAIFSLSGAVVTIANYLSYGFDIATALGVSLSRWVDLLCCTLIGIAYLAAKPKLAGLKIASCIIPMSIGLLGEIAVIIVNKGSGAAATFANFLCYTVMLYVAVMLYTPFKKK